MNAAEIKLDLFRRIDNIKETELEKIYSKVVAILNSSSLYTLSKEEREAIQKAIEISKNGQTYTHEEVMEEARRKYPNLRFK
jgi:UDP-N-acetylmuramyl tripeptide synthase